MLALTLHRPWSWAIFRAGKAVENRRWPLPPALLGKTVALHAGRQFSRDTFWAMTNGEFGAAARAVPAGESEHPHGIIGLVRFTTCVRANRYLMSPLEAALQPWFFGPFGWVIGWSVELREAIPCRGRQRFWKVPKRIEAEIREQVPGVAA